MTDEEIRRAAPWAADADAERAEIDRLAARVLCPDCHGRNVNLINPADGGSCPSCFGGYRKG